MTDSGTRIEDYLYGNQGPWPQPSPRVPNGMPGAVLHIPLPERLELSLLVISRYRATVAAYPPIARLYAFWQNTLDPVDDAEFARLLGGTVFSKFMCPTLDAADLAAFAGHLKDGVKGFHKVDFSAMADYEPDPGIYTAGTVTLFKKVKSHFKPVAIRINGLVVTPANHGAWELSKYFVLAGASAHLVTGFHGLLHFPMDAINAITKTSIPKNHLLFRLLQPHFRFSLALNHRVLEHPRSILVNDPGEKYTPFAGPESSVRRLVSTAYSGIPGNSAYQAYRFPLTPPPIPSDYGDFLRAYYDAMLEFVSQVVRRIPKSDPHVRGWADHVSKWVPGFPNGDEIFVNGNLAAAVAMVICDVSVMHAADHHSFAEQPIARVPFRLRVPPPTSLDMEPIDRSLLVTRDDLFRHKMAHQMFFKPTNLTLLHDTDYGFDDQALQKANRGFLGDLKKVDRSVKTRFIPLREISRSIQY